MSKAPPLPNPYRHLVESFTPEQLLVIGQIKRFFEYYRGDLDFKEEVDTDTISPENLNRLRQIGVSFELSEVAVIWEAPEVWATYINKVFSSSSTVLDFPKAITEAMKSYPLLELWGSFFGPRCARMNNRSKDIVSFPKDSPLRVWRDRQIDAARSELGYYGYQISYPLLAFELSDGCSIGCWFCAFSTRKLRKVFDYEKNGELFRQVIEVCVDLFGREQANAALLYYGTEPHDNPHYVDFMQDFADITGKPPCTATAVSTDRKWIHQLIDFYRKGPYGWPRLSVLSKPVMHEIHDLYSPDELRDVELLMQMPEALREKVTGGRILQKRSGLRDRKPGHYLDEIVPQGSISCVSGFLVNMVNRTIRLISPCYASDKWPLGYRIFDRAEFTGAESFRIAIEELISRNMTARPRPGMVMSFRDDLVYRATEEGFVLTSPNQVHHFNGGQLFKELGSALVAGEHSYDQLSDRLFDIPGINPIEGLLALGKIFENGFLNEVSLQLQGES